MNVRLGYLIIGTDLNYIFIFVLIIQVNEMHYFSNLFDMI